MTEKKTQELKMNVHIKYLQQALPRVCLKNNAVAYICNVIISSFFESTLLILSSSTTIHEPLSYFRLLEVKVLSVLGDLNIFGDPFSNLKIRLTLLARMLFKVLPITTL
jgi:hypothetical protein